MMSYVNHRPPLTDLCIVFLIILIKNLSGHCNCTIGKDITFVYRLVQLVVLKLLLKYHINIYILSLVHSTWQLVYVYHRNHNMPWPETPRNIPFVLILFKVKFYVTILTIKGFDFCHGCGKKHLLNIWPRKYK